MTSELLRHPDDELSAFLDGELGERRAAEVEAHVVACADCSAELDLVRATRASLRTLPAVEPPPGFLEDVLAVGAADGGEARVLPFRSRRLVLGNAAAAAAAAVLLVLGSGGDPAAAVSPEVGGAVEQHTASLAAVAVGGGDGGARSAPTAGPYVAPDELAGYRLVDHLRVADGLHLLYRKGPYALSVFEQRGRLDRGRLPGDGTPVEVDGEEAWHWEGRVVVLERGELVVTLVGDESATALFAAARALPGGPPPGPSWADRLHRACGDALEMLSPAS